MTLTVLASSRMLALIACLASLLACAAKPPPKADTLRICDYSGCVDRPKDYVSYNPAAALPGENTEEIAALEQLAANDPRAAYDLALRYFRGDGVRQDSYRSLQWMRDAAERGDLDAQKALGRLYLTGMGEMGADPGEAEKWLSITAARGDREAQRLLKEAIAARQSEQAGYLFRKRWLPVFHNYWYTGYRYRWYWGRSGWNYRY